MSYVKEGTKMTLLHSFIHPSIGSNHAGFSETNANQNSQGVFPSTEIIKLRIIMCNEKSPWRSSH
jgi:hypothetical protein